MTDFDYLTDPFKRRVDNVCIVGMATTTRGQAPWDDDDYEIWVLNEMGHIEHSNYEWIKRFDRLFQIHQRWDFMREGTNFNDYNHPLWLKNESGPCLQCRGTGKVGRADCKLCDSGLFNHPRSTHFPIYMQESYDDIPGSVRYPYEEIVSSYGPNADEVEYFTNSMGYMTALALYMKYKKIKVVGFEMGSGTEYSYQRPNAQFWLGIAIGTPETSLELADGSQLLKVPGQPRYGYDAVPELNRMHLEIKRNSHDKSERQKLAQLQQIKGAAMDIQRRMQAEKGTSAKRREKLGKELSELNNRGGAILMELNWHRACKLTYQQMMDELDAVFDPKGGSDKPKPVTPEMVQ